MNATADAEWMRPDAEFVAGILAGDREAFTAVYDRYADRLYDFCLSMLRNRPDADKKTPPESRNALAWGSWLAVLALGGYLLFAHGCHGDEDNELLAAAQGRGTCIGSGAAKNEMSWPG